MGKAERIRRMNARERIAAQQAAARRAEARRRMFIASGSVVVVIVIVIVLIIVKSASNTPSSASSASTSRVATAAITSSVTHDVTTVPASTLNSVGAGSGVDKLVKTDGNPPILTSGGKPEVLFEGAEYCPYCAAERWALTVALSRFGTFSGLHLIHSTSSDIYSNTATLSFYKATYTSKYLTFTSVELYGLQDNGIPLQKPTKTQAALMSKYDAPPYIGSEYAGSYPFVDFGNQYLDLGAQYVPSALGSPESVDSTHYGLSWSQIAADIRNPNSQVAQAVDGTANSITAAICKITKNSDASVCASPAAKAGAGSL